MSRALDQNETVRINASISKIVFDDLAHVLTDGRYPQLLEIELLGKSHELQHGVNYLQDGNCVAIPKSKLVQAFTIARRILMEHLKDQSAKDDAQVRRATAVILLTDPEHLTAANTRKRMLCRETHSAQTVDSAVNNELRFTDSLLTSPLHRHTKSPTLWSHRRWLIGRYRQMNASELIVQDLNDVIIPAAERHSRNYYAWHHLRWLLENLTLHTRGCLTDIFSTVKKWCFKNPSDISGWSFLLYSLRQHTSYLPNAACSAVCQEVIGLATSLRWTHESVWVFLRSLAASEHLSEEQKAEISRGPQSLTILSKTLDRPLP